jgi:hypothetical protein
VVNPGGPDKPKYTGVVTTQRLYAEACDVFVLKPSHFHAVTFCDILRYMTFKL